MLSGHRGGKIFLKALGKISETLENDVFKDHCVSVLLPCKPGGNLTGFKIPPNTFLAITSRVLLEAQMLAPKPVRTY